MHEDVRTVEAADPKARRTVPGLEAIKQQTVASGAPEDDRAEETNDMGVASCAVVAATGRAACTTASATPAPEVATTPRTSAAASTASATSAATTS